MMKRMLTAIAVVSVALTGLAAPAAAQARDYYGYGRYHGDRDRYRHDDYRGYRRDQWGRWHHGRRYDRGYWNRNGYSWRYDDDRYRRDGYWRDRNGYNDDRGYEGYWR